jgi:hypothetical protein
MKLLLDENLSRRIIPQILDIYPDSIKADVQSFADNPDLSCLEVYA